MFGTSRLVGTHFGAALTGSRWAEGWGLSGDGAVVALTSPLVSAAPQCLAARAGAALPGALSSCCAPGGPVPVLLKSHHVCSGSSICTWLFPFFF